LNATLKAIEAALAKGDQVTTSWVLVSFCSKRTRAHVQAVIPSTGEGNPTLKAAKVPGFKAGKGLKER